MPLTIHTTCKHCGKPIAQDDYFGDWFHTGRPDCGSATDMICTPGVGSINYAAPSLTVRPLT